MQQPQIGIDIIEIDRVKRAISRWGDRFLTRVYTNVELALYRNKIESLAARFAGKEAAIKALSVPGSMFGWREVEILSESSGKPVVHLYGQAQKQAHDLGLSGLAISLSHSKEYAIAMVIGEKEDVLT
jgi:holo-[acyl-carrier protein] synthase